MHCGLQAVFRGVLSLYPRAFRDRFGAAMTHAFIARVGAVRRRGRWAAAVCAFEAIADTAWHGLAERRLARSRRLAIGARKESHMLPAFGADLRRACRRLTARPSATALAASMLALAIGLTTAIFTVVDALIWRPLPFPEADRLAHVVMFGPRGGSTLVSPSVFRAWREMDVFDGVEGAQTRLAVVDTGSEPVNAPAALVSPGLFGLLGAAPIHGRLFTADEGRAGTADRVLVSETIWTGLFGRRPDLVGSRINVDGESLLVVGILPGDFRFPEWNTVIWRPLDFLSPPAALAHLHPMAYARVASGVPLDDAIGAASTVALAADAALASGGDIGAQTLPVAGMVGRNPLGRYAPYLLGGVVLVFLALCANVASLLLSQLTARAAEFRTSAALGAPRGRLFRQALSESALLGALGVGMGMGVAWALVGLARGYLPESFLLESLNPLDLDRRALAVACAVGFGAVLAAGVVPAWIGTKVRGGFTIAPGERAGTETRASRRVMRGLLVAEIAFSCTLLLGAGLLVRSFLNLTGVDRGLDATGVITGWVDLAVPDGATRPDRLAAAARLRAELEAIPGVSAVVLSFGVPPRGGEIYFGDDWQSDREGSAPVEMMVNGYPVNPDFFDFYGIRLLAGRTFEPGDDRFKVIVGERFAQRMWPDVNPIGRTYRRGSPEAFEVIGLVNEIRYPSVDPRDDLPEIYRPFGAGGGRSVMVNVRCRSGCPGLARLRQTLQAGVASNTRLEALDESYREVLARPRAAVALAVAFAAIAVLAAAGGLFSVLGYAVSRRRREFGIRASLGARPGDLQGQVIGEGLRLALAGLGPGCVGAWLVSRWVRALMYEVSIGDPASWIGVVGIIAATTILAVWVPARRAGRVSPVELLRTE